MNVADLMARCHADGLRIHLDGDRIRMRSDHGEPDAELLRALREARDEIVTYLRERARATAYPCSCCGEFFYPEPSITCYWCRSRTADTAVHEATA